MKKLTSDQKVNLCKQVYAHVFDSTESFSHNATGDFLAYLLGAILNDQEIELDDHIGNDIAFKALLQDEFDEEHPVWDFVTIVKA